MCDADDRPRILLTLDSNVTKDTLAAVSTCLFACLRPSSPPDVLDRSINIVRAALNRDRLSLQQTLYHAVEQFYARFTNDQDDGDIKTEEENRAILIDKTPTQSGNASAANFSRALALTLLEENPLTHAGYASDAESLRQARINMCLKLLRSPLTGVDTRRFLATVFQRWAERERSKDMIAKLEIAKELSRG